MPPPAQTTTSTTSTTTGPAAAGRSDGDGFQALAARARARDLVVLVVGLGRVGLTTAVAFAEAGARVLGVDRDPARAEALARGAFPFGGTEPELPEALARATSEGRLVVRASIGAAAGGVARAPDVVFVAVPTPADGEGVDLGALEAAVDDVARHLDATREGAGARLVFVESTLPPGALRRVARTRLDALGLGPARVALVYAPERVMPGRLLRNHRTMPRVLGVEGGIDDGEGGAADAARAVLALVSEVEPTVVDPTTAELVKAAENAYRDVNLAFANALALACERAGGDFWRVRELVNEVPERSVLRAGVGVGGACIPKDTWLLAHGAAPGDEGPATDALFRAARATNDAMPARTADLVARALEARGLALAGARIALLGTAYLEETDETVGSPSLALAEALRARGAEVRLHDPWVAAHAAPLDVALDGADAAVLCTSHRAYAAIDWRRARALLRTPVLVDGRGTVDAAAACAAGLDVWRVGQARVA